MVCYFLFVYFVLSSLGASKSHLIYLSWLQGCGLTACPSALPLASSWCLDAELCARSNASSSWASQGLRAPELVALVSRPIWAAGLFVPYLCSLSASPHSPHQCYKCLSLCRLYTRCGGIILLEINFFHLAQQKQHTHAFNLECS